MKRTVAGRVTTLRPAAIFAVTRWPLLTSESRRIVAHPASHRSFTAAQARFGFVLFAAGLTVLALVAWDNSAGLPFVMPGFFRSQRTTCLALALLSGAIGLFILSRGPREETTERRPSTWKPTRPGRRFRTITLYTRAGCPLCDEAFETLQTYSASLPPTQEIDIDADPLLRARFETSVPVVEIDGKIRFRGQVSEMLLRRLIEGTPPLES